MAKRKKSNEDESENSENINESDDNFGLPEIEYEPLNRETKIEETSQTQETETTERVEEPTSQESEYQPEVSEERRHEYVFDEDEKPSPAPKIIGGLIALLVIVAAVWYFVMYLPAKREAEDQARQRELVRQEAARKSAADAAELARQEREKRMADSLANAKPAEGAIETLSSRTGLYYVVVSSDIDDDLIMDYAKKLSKKGVSSKIIPPHGKVKFFRIAVAEAGSYGDAQAKADGMKGDYTDAWVVKY